MGSKANLVLLHPVFAARPTAVASSLLLAASSTACEDHSAIAIKGSEFFASCCSYFVRDDPVDHGLVLHGSG